MIKSIESLFRLGKYTVLRSTRKLFEQRKKRVLRYIRNAFEMKGKGNKDIKDEVCEPEEDYYKPIRIGNAFSSTYIEYKSNGD